MQIVDGNGYPARGRVKGGGIHIGGPKESFLGSGPGITEKIGPNADRMVDMMLHPKFIETAFGERPLEMAKLKREQLADFGVQGKFTGKAPGMSKGGDMQFIGAMPMELFQTLIWTDPELFNDQDRLEEYLNRAGIGVKAPVDY